MATTLVLLTGLLYLNLEKPHLLGELRRDPVKFLQDHIGGAEKTEKTVTTQAASRWDRDAFQH